MIRLATLKDEDAVSTIETECFKSDIMSRRSIRYMIQNPNAAMFVYIKDRQVVGYVLTVCHSTRRLAGHCSLAVLPKYQEQGIAKALILHAEKQFSDKEGCKLEVRNTNHTAIRLYERLGYHSTRLKSGYYEDGEDAIEMVKYFPADIE